MLERVIWCCDILKRSFQFGSLGEVFLVLGRNLQVEWCSLIISSKKIQGNSSIVNEGVVECVRLFDPFVIF